jgi:S-adenosylmethionine-diacylglycerol 3-amino-3-carboxypropyl transferase
MPLKFAVVREDPRLEAELVERTQARAILLVASGGCTALTLAARYPELEVVAFDFNRDQLEHVQRKAAAVAAGDSSRLNVEDSRSDGLNQCGEFEGLFRVLRSAIEEFVAPAAELRAWFEADAATRAALVDRWTASRYWPAVFAVAFNDALLHAMFGPDATQHAAPGSYPGYFAAAFERGLRREDGPRNPFLQHVLLGRYRRADAPDYIAARRPLSVGLVHGTLLDVPDLSCFDVVSLSNVFDWSDDALVAAWATRLSAAARPGTAVLIRQLNNRRDVRRHFPAFQFDDALGQALLARDRSLFYERIEVGFRR